MQRTTEHGTENLSKLGMFGNQDQAVEITTSKQLMDVLASDQICIVAYKPYLEQLNLTKLFSKTNPTAKAILEDYLKKFDVNVSNNLGMTLLHTLIWADRPDLASMVIAEQAFYKINFKFSLPYDMAIMYASALDLAIGLWRTKDSAINLELIELLLKHGAIPPKPDKKFLAGEFVSEIYPFMLPAKTDDADSDSTRSPDEIIDMFCLLHRYGFSIQEMQTQLYVRLFDTKNDFNGRAAEFAEKFGVSVEDQKIMLDDFMQKLYVAVKNVPVMKPAVEMTPERLDNGENTLRLPFDPHDRPCVVM